MDRTPIEELFAFGITEQYRVPVVMHVRSSRRIECGFARVIWCQGRQILVMEEDDYSQIREVELQSPDYERPVILVKKEVPGSEEIQKFGDDILNQAMKVERSRIINVGMEMTKQLKQHGLKLTIVDGYPILTKIENE